jgi:DNA-binding GntR family transcriptional regulator
VGRNVFNRIEQRTVQRAVVDILREAIVSGDLALGEDINETTIANQMAVSRAPLREGLRQLEQEGLIHRIPNRGCFIIDFSEQDVVEVFSLRATLECMALQLAAPHLTPEDFAALRECVEAAHLAIADGRLAELARIDLQFHEYICVRTGHSRLLRAWYGQQAQSLMLMNLRFRFLSDYTPETVVRDHTEIADALARGDTDTAIALTHSISERVQKELIHVLRLRAQAATPVA